MSPSWQDHPRPSTSASRTQPPEFPRNVKLAIVLVPVLLGAALGALGLASLRDARAGDHKGPECVRYEGQVSTMQKLLSNSGGAMSELDTKGKVQGVVLLANGAVLCAWYE